MSQKTEFKELQRSIYLQKDFGPQVERRVKVLTEGKDDTADPCVPVEIQLPNNEKICALYFSGGRVIYYSSLEELLRGGVRDFNKIEVQTKEGLPLIMEPFHQGEAIWDTELVLFQNNQTQELSYVGHGGMMERVKAHEPCLVAEHNYRRSRHAFSIEFKIEDLKIREIWKNLGPVHGHRPPLDRRWISKHEDQAHAHGYGSRMIRDEKGEPWRDAEGSMWMVYEEVTQEKLYVHGEHFPYATEIFARRMNGDLTLAKDLPVLLSSYSSWQTPEKPFAAAHRESPSGEPAGFLVEGPNPILLKIKNKEYWTLLFSAGDFVAEYGNYMMFREKEEGPIGPYHHVVDENGELINLTSDLVKKLDLTWAGRLNAFYDKEGQLWGLMHGIFKSDIPEGWKKSGWPRTAEEFNCYARRCFLVPLEVSLDENNVPRLICPVT